VRNSINPVRKSHIAFIWDKRGLAKKNKKTADCCSTKDIGYVETCTSTRTNRASYDACGATINKTSMKYGALMCIVNQSVT